MKNIGSMLRQRATVSPRLEAYVEPSANVRMDYTQMNALATNTNITDTLSSNSATGKYWHFDGPSVQTLMTSYDDGWPNGPAVDAVGRPFA